MGGFKRIDTGAFLARVLYPMFVVFATYNTSGYSFYHWIIDPVDEDLILKLIAAGLLGFGYYNIGEISILSLQRTGFLMVTVTCSAVAWYIIDKEWIKIESREDLINAMQFTVVMIMAIGLSYAHVHYRIGGIKQVEEARNIP
ncbi:MAG: hypothetical protein HQ481_18695 [Alphaproteobacteria bacterium]|nr:hypothetical protein [Alphaproteobacteria bacterium]